MKNGFSLIEVMVSVLILTAGVIGAAGMQLSALRAAQQSAFQTFALQLATDMAAAMQSGRKRIETVGRNPFIGIDYQSVPGSEPPMPAKLCFGNACDADELAEFEMYEWKMRVKGALPGGRVVVCRDSTPWDASKKGLSWDCEGESGTDAPVVIKLGWQAKNPDGSLVRDADKTFPPRVALAVAL